MRARAALLCALVGLLASGTVATAALASGESGLIDGRQWEQVSPQAKFGSSIEPIEFAGGEIQAAENGDAITYLTSGPFEEHPQASSGPEHQQIFSRRTAPGVWSTQDIETPHKSTGIIPEGEGFEYRAFSNDLSTAVLEPTGESLLPPPSTRTPAEQTIYMRDNQNQTFQPLVAEDDTITGALFGEPLSIVDRIEFHGSSPNGEHIVFTSPNELLEPNTEPGPHTLYEWSGKPGEPGHIQLVSITPKGENLLATSPYLGDGSEKDKEVVRNAISEDGTRIVFEAAGSGVRRLYLRDMAKGETVRLDTPEAGAEEPSEPIFQGANSDGTMIFFTDKFRLVAGADEGLKKGEGDLYVYEAPRGPGHLGGTLRDLTKGGEMHGFVIGYGSEGSGGFNEPFNVYFVNGGLLPSNMGPEGGKAVEEGDNLYLEHYTGSAWETPRFIATLSGEDAPSWGTNAESRTLTSLANLTSRVSGSGRFVVFMSDVPLTGYDNRDAKSGVRDEEVFEYDAVKNTLVCASCDPSGARPEGVLDPPHESEPLLLVDELYTWKGRWLAGSIPGWTAGISEDYSEYASRSLLDSGRLFFESPDGLVAGAVNHREDVFEYEPEGVGRGETVCGPGEAGAGVAYEVQGGAPVGAGGVGGCVGLVSGGVSGVESAFLDAGGVGPGGEEGEDVFFLTAGQLAPGDIDSAYDVYDAHQCSEKAPCATVTASVPPACSDTDSCRAAPAPQPAIYGAPSSATFNGEPNPAPTITPAAKSNTKPLTRGQQLAAALRTCKRERAKHRRQGCEKVAKRRYARAARSKKKA